MDKESFTQWMENTITKEVMVQIKMARDDCKETIIGYARDGNAIQAARISGNIEALDFLLNISPEEDTND